MIKPLNELIDEWYQLEEEVRGTYPENVVRTGKVNEQEAALIDQQLELGDKADHIIIDGTAESEERKAERLQKIIESTRELCKGWVKW